MRTTRKRTVSQRGRHACQKQIRTFGKREGDAGAIEDRTCGASSSFGLSLTCDVEGEVAASIDGRGVRRGVQRRTMAAALVAAAALLMCPSSAPLFVRASGGAALFVPPITRRHVPGRFSLHPSMVEEQRQHKQSTSPSLDTTWSNAVRQRSSDLHESRFGVRQRVRSVLDKAKKRTGIENSSTDAKFNGEAYYQSGPNIIAEAASLGGLVGVDDEEVALEYIAKGVGKGRNDTNANGANEASDLGTKYEDPAYLTKLGGEINGVKVKNGVKESSGNDASPSSSSSTTKVPSMSPVSPLQRPEDDFVLSKAYKEGSKSTPYVEEKDAFTGDVSAAFSMPREPLPFELPTLDAEQSRRLIAGERVQYQDDMGRAGSGYVVWDVKAPESVVWDCLLDFSSYPQVMTTVREVVMYTNTHLKEDYRSEKPLDFEDGTAAICKHGVPSVTRAQFAISKFRLKIAAIHKYRPHPEGDYMIFTLDPASTNMVLKYAKGIWYTQKDPDGKKGYTRIWLLCELKVSRLLPQMIVDYAAARAMPRATTWLKPQMEAAAQLWLKDDSRR